jgi:protein-tyrosine-phosphatase
MAQYLLNKKTEELGLKDWEAKSCGTAADKDFPTPPGVHYALGERGIQIQHTPQPVTRELLDWADVVLAMAQAHRQFLMIQYPEFTHKIHLFLDYAESNSKDVEDPIGQPDPVYVRCRDIIEQGLENILNKPPKHAFRKS